MERGRRVAPRCPRRYHDQCAAEAAGTRKPSSRETRFGPARMRVGKPANCYPSQAPSGEGSGDSVTRGCGRDAGIFNLERHRATTASRTESGSRRASSANRLHVRGKSLYEGDTKLHVRGVTYGTFRPDEETSDFPSVESVAEDFAGMAANGVNAVRTYTVPPRWLLDLAERARAVRDGRAARGRSTSRSSTTASGPPRSSERMREMVRSCAGHPAILCYAIGNEIPASIVRWHGKQPDRALPEAALLRGEERGPGRARDLRELPEHRVPLAALHRPRVLQRVPRVGPAVRVLPRSAAAHRRRPAAGGDGGRPRLAAQLRGGPGAGARLAGPDCLLRRLCRACSCSPGRTSGTAAGPRSTTGRSAWSTATAPRSRRWPRSARPTPRCRSSPDPDWPRVSVVVCAYNSEEHAAQLLRRPARRSSTPTTR